MSDAGVHARLVAELRAAGCVFAEAEADVLASTTTDTTVLAELVARRAAGAPLEHVVGWARFCGVRILVGPGVFVPRARSELLVDEAARLAARCVRRPTVVDLCCGSGAIGAAIAARVPRLLLYAADLDPVAVRCARANLSGADRVRAEGVYQGDLFGALPEELRGRIDVLVANVPYVPTGEMALLPTEARLHEPRTALDGGPDGLAVLARVARQASGWLAPAGAVLMETGGHQRATALATLARHDLVTYSVHRADLGATVVVGHRLSAGSLHH